MDVSGLGGIKFYLMGRLRPFPGKFLIVGEPAAYQSEFIRMVEAARQEPIMVHGFSVEKLEYDTLERGRFSEVLEFHSMKKEKNWKSKKYFGKG